MVSLAFRSGEDRAPEDRMRALLRPRVNDVDDVHAAAVHAGMSAKRRDAAGETQRAFAIVKKCLSRGAAAEEPGLGAIGIDDDVCALQMFRRFERFRLLPSCLEISG